MKSKFKHKALSLIFTLVMVALFACAFSAGNISGSFTAHGGVQACKHQLKKRPWSSPTCEKEGKKGAYQCEVCNKIFAYSLELDGLIEIESQETVKKYSHVVGAPYSAKLKNDKTKATAFGDYQIEGSCITCKTPVILEDENYLPFTPSTKLLYQDKTAVPSKRIIEDGLVSTQYTFPKNTLANEDNWVYHNDDNGQQNANVQVPFSANTDRHIIMFVKNSSSIAVTFKYGAEYWGAYCWSEEVTVQPNSVSAFTLKINFNGSDYACYHNIRFSKTLSLETTLTFSGYYVV